MSIPSSMQAVVINNDTAVVKSDLPVPQPGENKALVKIRAVAINPTDYKHIDYKLGPDGSVLGCDYAGEIVSLGKNSSSDFSVGDTICGLMHGASNDTPETGSFAEYAVVDLPTATKLRMKPAGSNELPAGKVETFEGAATLPCAMYTAAQVLTFHLGNKLLWEPSEPQNDHPLLIWGGATSCGQYAIQLAKKMNAYTKIIAVASKKHESLLKMYGADDLFDYHDANIEENIKEKYPNIRHVLDAASFPQTIRSVYKLVPADKPVHVVHLGRVLEDAVPANERKTNVKLTWPILYLISGQDEKLGPHIMKALPEYRENIVSFINFITPKLADGSILHMPLKSEKSLKSIPDLIDQLRKGNTSGSKLITTVQ